MLKKSIITFLTGATFITAFTFLPNLSKSVAQKAENTILIAQSSPKIVVQDLKGFKGLIVTLNTSPDGKTLIVASDDRKITQIVAKHNPSISIKVLETKGSVENQQLLSQRKADLALIQSDTPLLKSTKARWRSQIPAGSLFYFLKYFI